jgi:hypothetical protein
MEPNASVVGYTLSVGTTWMVILTANSRTIKYIPVAKVIDRHVCSLAKAKQAVRVPSPLIPLSTAKPSPIPSCGNSALPGSYKVQMSRWMTGKVATSSTIFRPIVGLSRLRVCSMNLITATLSVELDGAPAGFRIRGDGRWLMEPGAVRFIPAAAHDSFSFTFTRHLKSLNKSDRNTFNVEWRSPLGLNTRLERGTLVLQYQPGARRC